MRVSDVLVIREAGRIVLTYKGRKSHWEDWDNTVKRWIREIDEGRQAGAMCGRSISPGGGGMSQIDGLEDMKAVCRGYESCV